MNANTFTRVLLGAAATLALAVPAGADEAGEKALKALGAKAAKHVELEISGKSEALIKGGGGEQKKQASEFTLAYDRPGKKITFSMESDKREHVVFSTEDIAGRWSPGPDGELRVLPLERKFHRPGADGWAGGFNLAAPVLDALHGYAGTIRNFNVSAAKKNELPKNSGNLAWFVLELRKDASEDEEMSLWLASLGQITLGIDPASGFPKHVRMVVEPDEEIGRPAAVFDAVATTSRTKIKDKGVFDVPEDVMEQIKKLRVEARKAGNAAGKKFDP